MEEPWLFFEAKTSPRVEKSGKTGLEFVISLRVYRGLITSLFVI